MSKQKEDGAHIEKPPTGWRLARCDDPRSSPPVPGVWDETVKKFGGDPADTLENRFLSDDSSRSSRGFFTQEDLIAVLDAVQDQRFVPDATLQAAFMELRDAITNPTQFARAFKKGKGRPASAIEDEIKADLVYHCHQILKLPLRKNHSDNKVWPSSRADKATTAFESAAARAPHRTTPDAMRRAWERCGGLKYAQQRYGAPKK